MLNSSTSHIFFETGTFRSESDIVSRIYVPQNQAAIPNILVLVGPARCGSTAMGLVFLNQPNVKFSYFQPIKAVIRGIEDTFTIRSSDKSSEVIVVKETLGPIANEELFDPVDLLCRAGIPKSHIKVIVILRSPFANFSSLNNFVVNHHNKPALTTSYYIKMQEYTINLYKKYSETLGKDNVIPLVYELFAEYGNAFTFKRLFAKTNLRLDGKIDLSYNNDLIFGNPKKNISSKYKWGEGDPDKYPEYYHKVIEPTLRRNKFEFTRGTVHHVLSDTITHEQEHILTEKALPGYFAYKDISENFLFPEMTRSQ
jgi:hypothetical protein